ncbi:SGNH hydrolase domain-containing protein [Paraburkholderia fungorum]|uniref:SGNH hydrolase domain-containing protein n=1 Tax=Paraburkholderia fungorum TaxID=134537 RepID=UPI0036F264CE
MSAAGKHVVLMNDVPTIPMDLINCDFNNDLLFPIHRHLCQFDASIAREQHAPIAAMLRRIREGNPAVDIMHTYDVPCSETVCNLNFDGLPIYRFDDYHHLSAAGSSLCFPNTCNGIHWNCRRSCLDELGFTVYVPCAS